MSAQTPPFHPSTTPGTKASLSPTGRGILRLPSGPPHRYRLAQLDDYHGLSRRHFPWRTPITFKVRARASHTTIAGTWGFGLWNDPLSLSIGFGSGRKLPALPNTAWFFFASPENYLSLRDDLPANGALAATFRAPHLPVLILSPGVLALPLLFLGFTARFLRRVAARIVQQDSGALDIDPAEWHDYACNWVSDHVTFRVDEQVVFETSISPRGPLGSVIWMDNQYAAWKPDGGLKWGLLEGKEGWVEFEELKTL